MGGNVLSHGAQVLSVRQSHVTINIQPFITLSNVTISVHLFVTLQYICTLLFIYCRLLDMYVTIYIQSCVRYVSYYLVLC